MGILTNGEAAAVKGGMVLRHLLMWFGVLLSLGISQGCQTQNANSDLRLKLNTQSVVEVVVLDVPSTVSVHVALTPETLEQNYHTRLELRGGTLLNHVQEIDDALAATDCLKPSTAPEIRTAILFFDKDHNKVKSFYYGLEGKGGQIDHVPCELSPALYRWAKKYLPN